MGAIANRLDHSRETIHQEGRRLARDTRAAGRAFAEQTEQAGASFVRTTGRAATRFGGALEGEAGAWRAFVGETAGDASRRARDLAAPRGLERALLAGLSTALQQVDGGLHRLVDAVEGAAASAGADGTSEPLPAYDGLTAREVVERLSDATADVRARIFAYEKAHKARATILKAAAG